MDIPLVLTLLLSAAHACTLWYWLDLDMDCSAFSRANTDFLTWDVHHDEKQNLHDAKVFYGGSKLHVGFTDYFPYPPCYSFGAAAAAFSALGMCFYGLTNRGVRMVYPFLALMSHVAMALAFLSLMPGWWGMTAFFLYTVNFNSWSLSRLAMLENILQAMLTVTFGIWASAPEWFMAHLPLIAFLSGCCMIIKWSFAIYQYALLGIIIVVGGTGDASLQAIVGAGIAGLLIAEGINVLIFGMIGALKFRYINIYNVLTVHTGRQVERVMPLPPPTPASMFNYLRVFSHWFFHVLGNERSRSVCMGGGVCSLLCLAPLAVLSSEGHQQQIILSLCLFQVFYLLFASSLFFYLKRAVNGFPFTFLLLLLILFTAWETISPPNWVGLLIALSVCAVQLLGTIMNALQSSTCSEEELTGMTCTVERFLPEGSVIHADPYTYRMLWRTTKIWKTTWDEQLKDQQKIIEWALDEQGTYLLLAVDRDPVPPELAALLTPLTEFKTRVCTSDVDQRYRLFRINPAFGGPWP